MNSWQSFVVALFGQVTAITLVAAIAMWLAGRRSATRHAIGVVALGFLLASPLFAALLPRARWLAISASTAKHAEPSLASQSPLLSPEMAQNAARNSRRIGGDVAADVPTDSVAIHPATRPQAQPPMNLTSPETKGSSGSIDNFGADVGTWLGRCLTIFVCAWAAGITILCWRHLARRRQIRCLAASLEYGPIDSQTGTQLRAALGLVELPPMAVSDLAPMPLVLGRRRPVVVLPRSLITAAAPRRLRDVLIHECAHIVRGDPWINAAQRVAGIVFWPHPGVHWLNRQIAVSREELCDNFVLRQGEPTDYAQTLLDLAEQCSAARFALSLLGIFSARGTLEQRISGILDPKRRREIRTGRTSLATVTVVLSCLCALLGGVGAFGQRADEPGSPAHDKQAPAKGQPIAAPRDGTADKAADTKNLTIRGACQDQDAKPVPGARLRVFRQLTYSDTPKIVAETKSDELGRYSISGLETGGSREAMHGLPELRVVATASGHASTMRPIDEKAKSGDISLVMSSNPGSLSGVVTDAEGRPIKGVTVFPWFGFEGPLADFMCSVTDESGRYSINDVTRWKQADIPKPRPNGGTFIRRMNLFLELRHPNYAPTRGSYSGIPQIVDVILYPPAIVEGQVIDQVSGRPLADVDVRAVGIARRGANQARTGNDGRYRMLLNEDHYRIWAEADDRIAMMVKDLSVESGKTVKDVDIRMVRGAVRFRHRHRWSDWQAADARPRQGHSCLP